MQAAITIITDMRQNNPDPQVTNKSFVHITSVKVMVTKTHRRPIEVNQSSTDVEVAQHEMYPSASLHPNDTTVVLFSSFLSSICH